MHNFYIFLTFFVILKSSDSRIVSTSFGSIEGLEILSDANIYHTFKKVPFAQPPIGKLRFQKPQKVNSWDGVLNGKEYGPACLSNSSVTSSPQKSVDEDCLHVNIFTTEKCMNSKDCPVVFYIHGGGMEYDSSVMFNDTFLFGTFSSRDIILVISAYRLGFLSHFIIKDQTVAPTNVGLYDLLEALEFIQSEIRNFGGDPNRVTIFGHSFGAAVASAFTFSNKIDLEQRLFQQAVAMSPGREFHHLDYGLENTLRFVERANCTSESEQYILECLQKMDQFELLSIQRSMEEEGLPAFEFMTQREPLFQEGLYSDFFKTPRKLPFMTGCTLKELARDKSMQEVGEIYGFQNRAEVDQKYRLDKKLGKLKFNLTDTALTMKGDVRIRANYLSTAEAPTYIYEYNYPKHSEHTDDLSYLMGVHVFEKDENEEVLSKMYPEYFMNFVKYGKPAEDWEVFNVKDANYYDVNWNFEMGIKPQMRNDFEKELHDYWFFEMREFDENVTICKQSPKLCRLSPTKIHKNGFPIQTAQNAPSSFNLSTFYIFMSLLFLSGIFIGKYFCGRKEKNVYVRIDGSDFENYHLIEEEYKLF